MIDAYEIGIQLALQDDVSAGLAVISRELADVDRAIAATNAGLVQLVHTADAVKKAVIGVDQSNKRPTVGPSPELVAAKPNESVSVARGRPSAESARDSVPVTSRQEVSVPIARPERAEITRSAESSAPISPQADYTPQVRSAIDQKLSVQTAPIIINQNENSSVPPQIADASVLPVSPTVQALQSEVEPLRQSVGTNKADALSGEDRSASPTQSVPGAVTASLAAIAMPPRDRGGRQDVRRAQPWQQPELTSNTAQRGVAAPSRNNEPRQSAPSVMTSAQRAVAPQPPPRDQSDSGGGTVMLDGRLVGYWLSEQMARDASRPPSGTTYFDPRQTPAWSASGAL